MKIIILCVLFIKYVLSSSRDSSLSAGECNYCRYKSCTPTVFPATRFDAKEDAKRLEAAILRNGGQENIIVSILTSRSDYQRLKILEEYISSGKVLIDEVKKGVKSEALSLLEALTKPLPMFLVDEIHDALQSKDHETLNEIFVSLPNCAIREISFYYRLAYKTSLIDSIVAYKLDDYGNFLIKLAKANRDESGNVNEDKANEVALSLVDALSISWRTSRPKKFIEVFTTHSFPQLKAIFKYYRLIRENYDPTYKNPVDDFTKHFGISLGHGLVTMYRNVLDQHSFFSRELHLCFLHYATKRYNRTLIRIIRTRCEVDLEEIKKKYQKTYQTSLLESITKLHGSETRKAFHAVLNESW